MQQQDERQKIANWFIKGIMDAYDIEKAEFAMQGPTEMIISCRLAQYPEEEIVEVLECVASIGVNQKRCYVRMEDGTETEFRRLNECVKFIQSTAVPGELVITDGAPAKKKPKSNIHVWRGTIWEEFENQYVLTYVCNDFPGTEIILDLAIGRAAECSVRDGTSGYEWSFPNLQKAKTFVESGALAKAVQEFELMKKNEGPFS